MTQTEGGEVECALQRKFLVWVTKRVDECQWEKPRYLLRAVHTREVWQEAGAVPANHGSNLALLQHQVHRERTSGQPLLSDAVSASEGSFSTEPCSPGFQSLSVGVPASLGACSQTWLLPPVMELLFF